MAHPWEEEVVVEEELQPLIILPLVEEVGEEEEHCPWIILPLEEVVVEEVEHSLHFLPLEEEVREPPIRPGEPNVGLTETLVRVSGCPAVVNSIL